MFRQFGPLMAPEPDLENEGGDAGFSEAQVKLIGQIVNQATTAQLKRNLGPGIAEAVKAINWTEMIAPEIAKLAPPAPDEGKGKGKTPESTDLDRRIQQLAEDLEKEKKRAVDADTARQKAEHGRKVDAARTKLRNALADKVASGALDHAVDRLTLVQNRLNVDDDGNATFRVRRPEYKGGQLVDIDLSIEEALPVLLAEEDMKIYMPAPSGNSQKNGGPRNSGTLPTYATPAQTDLEKVQRALEKERALAARFNIQD